MGFGEGNFTVVVIIGAIDWIAQAIAATQYAKKLEL